MKTHFRLFITVTITLLWIGISGAAAQVLFVGEQGVNTPITSYALPGGGGAPAIFATPGQPQDTVPRGLAFDNSGNLYVAYHPAFNADQVILKIGPSGNSTVFADANSGLADPYGLAFGTGGNLFVSSRTSGIIQEITPGGNVSFFANAGPQPSPLAFHDGNLYCVNIDGTVMKYDASGNATQVAQLMNAGLPGGLVFDTYGNMFVSSPEGVEELTATGTDLMFANFAFDSPQTTTTRGLAIDSQNNLYVSNLRDSIWKVAPDGTISLFAQQTDPSFMIVSVPEPSGIILMALGMAATRLLWRGKGSPGCPARTRRPRAPAMENKAAGHGPSRMR
ncbi:MAG TPA: PEP-CTERM sorting domain-containing protein [Verrucomicrobiae bacterium]|nr:PEP-CTERM sorting domain-containing protein [Verrucomicrobiae bacterium]